jgi:hypothetical protein
VNLYAGSSRPVLFSDRELRAVHSLLLGGPKQWDEFKKSTEKGKDELKQPTMIDLFRSVAWHSVSEASETKQCDSSSEKGE